MFVSIAREQSTLPLSRKKVGLSLTVLVSNTRVSHRIARIRVFVLLPVIIGGQETPPSHFSVRIDCSPRLLKEHQNILADTFPLNIEVSPTTRAIEIALQVSELVPELVPGSFSVHVGGKRIHGTAALNERGVSSRSTIELHPPCSIPAVSGRTSLVIKAGTITLPTILPRSLTFETLQKNIFRYFSLPELREQEAEPVRWTLSGRELSALATPASLSMVDMACVHLVYDPPLTISGSDENTEPLVCRGVPATIMYLLSAMRLQAGSKYGQSGHLYRRYAEALTSLLEEGVEPSLKLLVRGG